MDNLTNISCPFVLFLVVLDYPIELANTRYSKYHPRSF